MRNACRLLLPLSLVFSLLNTGCARERHIDEPQSTSPLENLPFVYKMTVQQGNVLSEEQVDVLKPGMTRAQVRYLLGTPLLVDFFHGNRWDYTYTIKRGHQPIEIRRLTLHFKDDSLARIEGDLQPNPQRAAERESRQILVEVPDYEDRKGVLTRMLETVGLEPGD